MKRTLALVLAAFIALSLTACGNSMDAEDVDRALDIAEQLVEKLPEEIELDNITADTPAEEPAEQPEAEQPKVEEPKKEEPKAEEPKVEEPKAEEPKQEEPKVEQPKTEQPKVEEPKIEEPKVEEPKKEEPDAMAPVVNEFFNPNNNFYDINAVSVKPRHVYWDENGYLVAECFVINGYNRPVHTIGVKTLTLSNNDCVIASGEFGGLRGLTLQPYTHYIWTFRFHPNDVVTKGADLSLLNYRYSTTSKF